MPSPIVLVAIGIVSLVIWRVTTARRLKLPPTPAGLPLLGNLLQMPSRLPWETYMAWSKEVDSDIVHINLAGTHLIVLNSELAISDLFDKRSTIYQGRPQISMIELTGWANCFALADDGDTWKHQRRMIHSEFSQSAIGRYRPQVTKTARALLLRLLEKPDKFTDHFTHLAGSLITLINYGIDVKDEGDPYIEAALEGFVVATQSANLGKFFVNALPFLKYVPAWVPGAGFQKTIVEFRNKTNKMLDGPYDKCKSDMNSTGASHESFARNSIERIDDKSPVETQEQNIKWAAVGMLLGGIDTTSNTMGFFLLSMVLHPEVQRRAQDELDRVVEPGSLPDFSDEPQLPYITAIVREVLRWEPVGPTGIPHIVAKDDEYRGYDIPKGSLVIGNLWSILHDEKQYPEPSKFNPDRFMKDGKLNPDVPDPLLNGGVFGAGRRVCPGRYLASTTLWVAMASILYTMNLSKATDSAGNVIEPDVKINPDLPTLQALLPFDCSIKPRSKEAEDLIRSSAMNAA